MGGLSIWHWVIVLVVVVLVFGTKKLKNVGSDLGSAVKGFKDGMTDGGTPPSPNDVNQRVGQSQPETVDVQATEKKTNS